MVLSRHLRHLTAAPQAQTGEQLGCYCTLHSTATQLCSRNFLRLALQLLLVTSAKCSLRYVGRKADLSHPLRDSRWCSSH